MSDKSKISIEITSNVASATNGIQSVTRVLGTLDSKLGSVKDTFTSVASTITLAGTAISTVTSTISKLTSAAKELIDIYAIQEQAETRIQSALKATSNACGMTASDLLELASSLQSVTTFGDETILKVEQLFVSTKKVGKDIMPEATKAVLDLAAAMGEDATGAAKSLAKVLADPKSNLDALKDSNIQLTQSQKDSIKELQDQNRLYDAQKIVLEAVESSYGGMAEDIAKTDTGKLTQIANVWGDIKEGLGEGLLDSISPALDALYEKLLQISSWVSRRVTTADIVESYQKGKPFDFRTISDEDMDALISNLEESLSIAYGGKTLKEKILKDMYNEQTARFYGIWIPSLSKEDLALFEKLAYDNQNLPVDWWNMDSANPPAGSWSESTLKLKELAEKYKVPQAPAVETPEEVGNNSTAEIKTAQDYINDLKKYSISAQIAEIDKSIQEGEALLSEATQEESKSIQEIIEKLVKEKETLLSTGETTTETAGSYVDTWKKYSVSAQIAELDGYIEKGMQLLSEAKEEEKKKLEEIIASLTKERDALAKPENPQEPSAYETILSNYGSMSTTNQLNNVESAIKKVKAEKELYEVDSEEYKILEEITEELEKQKKTIQGIVDEAETGLDRWQKALSVFDEIWGEVSRFFDIAATLYDREISKTESALDTLTEKWDEYFEHLDDQQKKQSDSLNAMLASGNISYEDYINALNGMDDERLKSEKDRASEEDVLAERVNELKQGQFEAEKANAIATATINAAMSITDIWAKHGGNPALAGILTGLSAATTAAEIATIASQSYTPMAAGGIVSAPTRALIGEGASPELVLPLNETNMQRYGFRERNDGQINISINIGASYSSNQLSEDVFRGIERAQRTGLLPNWRYTA